VTVRVVQSATFDADVRRVADWYLREAGVDVARRFAENLAAAISVLEAFPRLHPHSMRVDARRVRINRFPYLIWYRVRADVVTLYALSHVRRGDPASFLP